MSLRASVVVVSRHRAEALRRCLVSLQQVWAVAFEVIVVADSAGIDAVGDMPGVIRIPFDAANIAQARNLGIDAARGDIISFIDDDAVAEPCWLERLLEPFADPEVAAVGGYVIGRNGFSYQWKGRLVSRDASTQDWDPGAPIPDGWAVKTEGTNMAVRSDVLRGLGGFDPAYRFYLDETDLNIRLAQAGHRVDLVPDARVHHGFAESARRGPDRVPRDLTDIGRSTAAFARRHAPDQAEGIVARIRAEQAARVARYLANRKLTRDQAKALMAGFDTGVADAPAPTPLEPRPSPVAAAGGSVAPFPPPRPRSDLAVVSGRPWQRARVQDAAQSSDQPSLAVILEPTTRRHQLRFLSDGYWLQTGGIWGASERSGPMVQPGRFGRRVGREAQRLAVSFGIRLRKKKSIEQDFPHEGS